MVGMVVKFKIGELEEEVRASSSRRIRKELIGSFQGVSVRRRFLVRFQNGFKKNMYLNQLTLAIVEKILVEEEPDASTIPYIPEDQVEKEKGYYCCVYVMLQFKNEASIESKEEQADMGDDTDEEDTEDII